MFLREELIYLFQKQGFKLANNSLEYDVSNKKKLRKLNKHAIEFLIKKNEGFIKKYQNKFLERYIVDGKSIDVKNIQPRLSLIENEKDARVFRWIKLHWSIPVSAGYGRRIRYIVYDDNTGGIIGIIGLGDPVYSLGDRDALIGWSNKTKAKKLKHLMDAFVLGAVPPYNMVLGGKLVASLTATKEVYSDFKKKYGGKKSLIKRESFDGSLVAITTASALGKSSLYDRIKIPEGPQFIHVGWTRGSGEFHFMNGYYERLLNIVKSSTYTGKNQRWGSGTRSRRVVVRKALSSLGLPMKFQYHGVKREIFLTPLGGNWKKFLTDKQKRFRPYNKSVDEVSEYIKNRWMIPRSERDKGFEKFRKKSYALKSEINL